MCKIFKLSKINYYHWSGIEPSKRWSKNQIITEVVFDIFKDSFGIYRTRRVIAELLKRGYRISTPRGVGIMNANNPLTKRKCKFKTATPSSQLPDSPQYIEPRLYRLQIKSSLGNGYNLYKDRTGLDVSNGNHRPVPQKGCWVVNGPNFEYW